MMEAEDIISAIRMGGNSHQIKRRLRAKGCPKEALEYAAKHRRWDYRCAVAEGYPPKKILGKLAKDRDLMVRLAVASNNRSPKYGIKSLIKHKEETINTLLAQRTDLSEKQYIEIMISPSVQMALAKNETLTEKLYSILAKEGTRLVKIVLCRNTRISEDIQMMLAEDRELATILLKNKNLSENTKRYILKKHKNLKEGKGIVTKKEYERLKREN